MFSLILAFISVFVPSLHSQELPSIQKSKEDNVHEKATFSRCSSFTPNIMESYLDDIVLQIENPGSIFMVTDCVIGLGFDEDIRLFSYVSFAFMTMTMLQEKESEILGTDKLLIVVDLPGHASVNVSKEVKQNISWNQIYSKYQNSSQRSRKWQPTILIVLSESDDDVEDDVDLLRRKSVEMTLDFDCNIFAIALDANGQSLSNETAVWEMYNIKQNKIISEFGKISLNNHISIEDKRNRRTVSLESYARRRRNFQLATLTASVKYDPSFSDWIGMTKKIDGNYRLTEGYVAYLYWDLQMLMNFSENVILGDSPYVFPNGTLGGITVRQLETGETDLTLNQISFSPHRAKVLTFLHPTYYSFVHAFFKQPTQNSIRDMVIATFRKELWITLIGVWVILVMSVKVRPFLLRKICFTPPLPCSTSSQKDYRFSEESILWSVAAFCQKTWYLDPHSTSLRMKFMIGSIVGVMTYTAYSAAICSSLAVNHVPVKSFFDLITFNFIFTVHERSEPFQTMLRGMIQSYNLSQDVSTVSTEKEISHLYSKSNTIASDIRSEKKVFLSPADMFYKTAVLLNYSDSFICDHISSMHAGTYLTKSAMLVKKESQFKEVLNYMLVYLTGRGLLFRNIASYNTKNFLKCIPIDQQDSKVSPADFKDISTIIMVLSIGMPAAVLFLVLEIMLYWTIDHAHFSKYYFKG